MATNNPSEVGGNDPSVQRQIERQNAALQQSRTGLSSPPSVSGTTGPNVTTTAGAVRNLAPIVSGSETLFPQSTTATSNNAVTINSSINNDTGDVTTVYSTNGRITVNPINQTINQYTSVDSGVSQIVAGTGVTITSTGNSGTGVVTVSSSTAFGNIVNVNLNGNVNSVLRGDGTWGADANSSYGNSNVVSLLASFGSNTITTTGNVSVGNISATNLGNIVGTNYDGNVSNVLHGDGTWSADVTNYGNSNVANYLPTYTGNLSGDYLVLTHDANANVVHANYLYGDGSNITNLPVGNISSVNLDGNSSNLLTGAGTYAAIPVVPTVGNVASLNLDGNVSNVLRGNGTWGPDANSSYGDSNVTSLLGAFGSNTIVTTGIITADGANLSNVPYANLTGAPSLGNISSLNLDGNASNLLSGAGTYVAIPTVPTVGNIATLNLDGNSQTWLAGNGVFANIAIPSVGNIAVINLDGNASNVLRGDGTWSADANSAYGDSNVTSLLGAFGSNTIVTTGIITADGANLSNVPYANLTGAPTLGNIASVNLDGNVSNVLAGNGTFVALPVINANTVVWSTAPVANTSNGTAGQAAYDSGGNLYVCVATDTWAKFTGTTSW